MPGFSTQAIHAGTDIIRPVDLTLPDGVSPTRREQVVVHVAISPLNGSRTLRIGPVAQNVPEGLEATVERPAVNVTVAGPEPALVTLRPEDVRVSVDLTDQVEGTHTLTPTVSVPSAVRVVAVEPPQVEVTLR